MAINGLLYESGAYATTGDLATAGGLVYITGNTFSASSAVNVNNCFTSTYDNYHIQVCRLTSSVGANVVNLRLRLSGTDASGTDYNRQYLSASSSTVTGVRSTGLTSMIAIGRATTAEQNIFAFDIFNPNRATITAARIYDNEGNTGTGISLFLATFSHALTTAYDGFTLLPDSGNISGTVRVYGYRTS